MKSLLKKNIASCKIQKLTAGASFSIVSIIAIATTSPANAQVGITSLDATYQTGTSSSYNTQVADPCNTSNYPTGCNSNINMQFGVGATNDLKLSGFSIGAQNYSFIQLADSVKFRRINNAAATGARQLSFFEYNTNNQIRSSYTNTMAEAMLSTLINRGIDNAFSNSAGDVASNNIERIDYIVSAGLAVPNISLNNIGFLILERNGNDPFQIAAITSLDGSGNPTGFGPLKSVATSTWGKSSFKIKTAVMRREENETAFRPSHLVGEQTISGIYVSISSLDVTPGQKIYGYAIFPNDITASNDLINLSDFPTNTSGASGQGGLDLMAGGAIFMLDGLTTISGTLYEDSDGGNDLDAAEPKLPGGITVKLLDNSGSTLATATTDANGAYIFTGVASGNYTIQVDTSTVPSGYALGTPNDLAITVSSGTPVTDQNFGFDLVADLSVTKTDNQTTITPGSAITYTITVSNNGSSTVKSLTLNDTLPTNIENPSFTPSTGSYNNSTGAWTGLNLANGQSITLTVQGTVSSSATGTITNTATVAPPSGIIDPNNSNNSSTDTTIISNPDLTISKTDGNNNFNAGSTGSYTITVNNAGNATTSGTITVTDNLPTGLSVADGSLSISGANAGDWTCSASGNTITCTSSKAIATSGSSSFSFNVNVANNAPSSVTNNVSVSGGGEPTANNGNNTGSDTTNIIVPATSGPTFTCDGQFWLAQIPSGGNANTDPSELSIVDTSNKVLNLQFTLNNPSNVFVNAIGFNVQDGYMYGIDRKNQLTDRDNEDVVRIAADGTFINLGNPYGIGSAAGDVSPDGIYYIFSNKKFYKFNVTGLNSATSAGIVNIQNSSSIPGFLDIAFNPFDGKIYATHQTDDKIYIIDPNDGSFRTLTAPGLNLTGATGAMYFDPFGNFYAYQNSNGNLYKVVFDNPANPQSASATVFVPNPPNVSKNDGSACPFQPRIEKTVDPKTTPAGQSVTYTYRLTNPNGYPITTKLTDTMPNTDGRTFISVTSNPFGGTQTISGDQKTLEITGLTLPGLTVNTITVTVNVPANTPATASNSPLLNQANLSGLPAIFGGTVLSDYPDEPGFKDPTPLQVTVPIATNPNVLLVKRITAINGNNTKNPNDNTPLNTFVDDTTSSKKDDDNNSNWPSNYLIGAIDGGKVKPGDEIEYTIYFLSTGDNTAKKVLMCDFIPEHMTFSPTAFNSSPGAATGSLPGADRGTVLNYKSNTVSLSNVQDGDGGQYFSPGVEPSTVYANIDCDGNPSTNVPNTNGAVVVNLGDLPHATTPGQSDSYGFVRFRAKVK